MLLGGLAHIVTSSRVPRFALAVERSLLEGFLALVAFCSLLPFPPSLFSFCLSLFSCEGLRWAIALHHAEPGGGHLTGNQAPRSYSMTLGALETHDVVGFAFSSLLSCPSVSFPSLSEHGWRHCKSSIRRFGTLCHYSSVLCPELSYTLFLFFGIVPFVIFTLSLFFGLVPFYVRILRTFGCTYLWDGLGLGWGFGFVLVFFLKVFLNVWVPCF